MRFYVHRRGQFTHQGNLSPGQSVPGEVTAAGRAGETRPAATLFPDDEFTTLHPQRTTKEERGDDSGRLNRGEQPAARIFFRIAPEPRFEER